MGRTMKTAHCRSRPLLIAGLIAVAVVALAVAAPAAFAWPDYVHNTAQSCSDCHPNGTGAPGADSSCQACHTGFQLHPGSHCWSCHKPGVAPGATQAACTGTCHMWTGPDAYSSPGSTPHGATPHLGSNLETCLNCHKTSASGTDPNGSPHHNGEVAPESPTCTTCHTSTPVDKAPVPHAPLVVSVTSCVTCHVGMTPHPVPSGVASPTITINVAGGDVGAAYRVVSQGAGGPPVVLPGTKTASPTTTGGAVTASGTLAGGAGGLASVNVFLQVEASGAADFTTLAMLTTAADGSFTFPMTATLTLKVSPASITFGKSVAAGGKLGPAGLAGKTVKLLAQMKKGKKWVKAGSTSKKTKAVTGAYTWKFKPKARGAYRIMGSFAKTAINSAVKTPWRTFKVK